MHERIVIERRKARVGIAQFVAVERVVPPQPADHIRQRGAADADNHLGVAIAQGVARVDDPAHGDQRVGDTPDRIGHAVVMHPIVPALEHRMNEQCAAQFVGGPPERVERRIVEHAADAFRLRADHRADKAGRVRLAQHLGGCGAVLKRHGREWNEARRGLRRRQ